MGTILLGEYSLWKLTSRKKGISVDLNYEQKLIIKFLCWKFKMLNIYLESQNGVWHFDKRKQVYIDDKSEILI